jgi:hypothetical protein
MAEDPRFPRLILRCGESFEFFVLTEEGKTWTKRFTTMFAALTYAEVRYDQPVNLTILNDVGTFVSHEVVNPRPPSDSN